MTDSFEGSLLGPHSESEKICLAELGVLICAGRDVPEALLVVAQEKSPFSSIFKIFAARMLSDGKQLWEILGDEASGFSQFVPSMIHAGEEAKCLGSVLIDAGDIIAATQQTLRSETMIESREVLAGINYYMWALLKNAALDDTLDSFRFYETLASCAMLSHKAFFSDVLEKMKSGKSLSDAIQNQGLSKVEEGVLSMGKIAHLTDFGLNGLANLLLKENIGIRLDALKVKR